MDGPFEQYTMKKATKGNIIIVLIIYNPLTSFDEPEKLFKGNNERTFRIV